jgi:hypothetical protein
MASVSKSEWRGFGRVHVYARGLSKCARRKKRLVLEILQEAARILSACPHVENPREPIIYFGLHPKDLINKLEFFLTERKGKFKKPRYDVPVLQAAVYSWPEPCDRLDHDRFDEFVLKIHRWHTQLYGEVDSVVIHLDETYPHIHIFIVHPLV